MDWKDIEKKLDKIYSGQKCAEDIEGQFLEIKKCPKKIKDVIRVCRDMAVCFANADGGSLVLGVENNIYSPKAFTGCQAFEGWRIAKEVYRGTEQPVAVQVDYHPFNDVELIEMKVPKGIYEGAHALKNGAQSMRSGADCIPLLPSTRSPKFVQADRIDNSRSIIENIEIDDLNKNEIKLLRREISNIDSSSDFLKLNEDKDLLKALGMINEEKDGELKITNAAMLFLGDETNIKKYIPNSELVFLAYDDTEKEAIEKRYVGGLLSIILDFQELYNRQFNSIHHLDTGLFEIEIPKIPKPVLREALLNAVTHRDYLIPSSVFFNHYYDKIEIISPGSFPADITPNNILKHNPVWRNRLIAEIFQKIGLVRRSGLGVDRMYRYLLNSGKEPPIFTEEGSNVTLTIYDRIDENLAKYLINLDKKGRPLPLDEMIILSKLKIYSKITTDDAAKSIQTTHEDAKILLNKMHNHKRIERGGKGRGTYYRLSSKIYEAFGDSVGYIRNGDIDKRRKKELIIEFIKDKGRITNRQVQELCNIDRNQAFVLLEELENDKKIIQSGKGRKAGYVIIDYKFEFK